MLGGIPKRLLRSKRVLWALLGNGSVSVSSLFLSIAIARVSSVEVFGAFSIAMVVYLFMSGLVSAAFTNIALVKPNEVDIYLRNLKRVSLASLVVALFVAVSGLVFDNLFLFILSITLHGLMISNYQRVFNSAAGKARNTFNFTQLWVFPVIMASVISFFVGLDPLEIFLIWSLSGALSGYCQALVSKSSFSPEWRVNKEDSKHIVVFSMDFCVGEGATILTTGLLGLLENSKILGAIRGSGTLLGPVNLLSTTARSLILPFLAIDNENPKRQFRSAIAVSIIQVVCILPILLVLQFVPDSLGTSLLGDTWELASLAILPMSIDAIFSNISGAAISGHRAFLAGKRTLALRLITGLSRPIIVFWCAFRWGVVGASYSMASVAALSAFLWWLSYWKLSKTESKGKIS